MLRKFFETGASEEGGGPGAADEKPIEAIIPPTDIPEKVEIPASQLKAWGFESVDQMNAHFEKTKVDQRSEDDIRKEAELENLNFRTFAIKEGHLKEDDIRTYERLTSTPDRDLVFQDFMEDYKTEHPEIEPADLNDAAKEAFDAEYKTASDKRIAKLAKDIRSEVVTTFDKAKNEYSEQVKWDSGKERWNAFVKKAIDAALPGDDLTFFDDKDGNDDVKISVKMTPEQKAEVAKSVLTPRRYAQFIEGDETAIQKLEATIKERLVSAAKQKHLPDAIRQTITKAVEIGKSRSPFVGATNPFSMAGGGEQRNQGNVTPGTIEEMKASHAAAGVNYIP